MAILRRQALALVGGLPFAGVLPLTLLSRLAEAATPKDTLVIASQIDDIITLDPGEEYEISGQILVSNIYDRLVRYEAEDITKLVRRRRRELWRSARTARPSPSSSARARSSRAATAVTAEDVAWSLQRVVLMDKTPAFLFTQLGWTKDNVKD